MGIDRTDYVVYGWKFPEKLRDAEGREVDLWADRFLPYIEGHQGVEYVIVRGDNYVVFGFVVAHGGDQDEGWGFEPLDRGLPKPHEVQLKYCELFGYKTLSTPSLFIFTRWH